MGRQKRLGASKLIVMTLLWISTPVAALDTPLDSSGYDLEEISVCAKETPGCRRESCLDICVEQEADPMECPALCNQSS